MERQLDLTQSGQSFLDGGGPYTPEPSQEVLDSTHNTKNKSCDSSQIEATLEDGTIRVEVEKDSIRPKAPNTFKPVATIEGTHYHIKNSLNHVCSNAPFPDFFATSAQFTDRTEFVRNKIKKLVYDYDYPNLEQILKVFLKHEVSLFQKVTTKFPYFMAKTLFGDPKTFYYSCLTAHDCNLLRIELIFKHQLRSCHCATPNSIDISQILATPFPQGLAGEGSCGIAGHQVTAFELEETQDRLGQKTNDLNKMRKGLMKIKSLILKDNDPKRCKIDEDVDEQDENDEGNSSS